MHQKKELLLGIYEKYVSSTELRTPPHKSSTAIGTQKQEMAASNIPAVIDDKKKLYTLDYADKNKGRRSKSVHNPPSENAVKDSG